MQIRFGELAQEVALVSGHKERVVLEVLSEYSRAAKAALAENLIVEIIEDVRVQWEDYFDIRNSSPASRLIVNAEHSRPEVRKAIRGAKPDAKRSDQSDGASA